MNKRHYEHTLPNIRGSLSNTYTKSVYMQYDPFHLSSLSIGLYGMFLGW